MALKQQNIQPASPTKTNLIRRQNRICFKIFLLFLILGAIVYIHTDNYFYCLVPVIAGFFCSASLKVASEWEKAVVLRLGKYTGLRGPGHFWIIPFIDEVAYWIDQRVVATPFIAEQTLTKDTVPVNVDAILFWMVWDPEKASLEVENYREAVAWTAQTALRDVVGRSLLSDLLSCREQLDKSLQEIIDHRTEPWGVTVQSVEIRDVIIPEELQETMSREAQATRERRARIILATTETEVANCFTKAAEIYASNPAALQLRAMNILYEGLKEKNSMIITPSSIADSFNIGAFAASQMATRTSKKKHSASQPAPDPDNN